MFRTTRWIAVFASVVILLAVTGSLVYAIFPTLQTKLSGPDINGEFPIGDAKVDQSGLPNLPAQLRVRVKNVNLPGGTRLDVILGRMSVGTITLAFGEGSLDTTFQFQVGRLDPILVVNGADTILSGGAPWQISSEIAGEVE